MFRMKVIRIWLGGLISQGYADWHEEKWCLQSPSFFRRDLVITIPDL
jgi:hypothetical protein